MFTGRDQEFKKLELKFKSKKSELIVVYGRRRIGKSTLIQEFIKDKQEALYFDGLENEKTHKQIIYFKNQLSEQLKDPILKETEFKSWAALFNYLTNKINKNKSKTIIVLDELQWMAANRTTLISILKSYWDKHWKKQNVMLILCGSVASFMVDKVVHSKALYGRINLEILLKALKPNESIELFKNKRSLVEVLRYLLLFGGVPKYLEEINLNKSFTQNMNELCFKPKSLMIEECKKIFYSQFKEAQTYKQIVKLLRDKIYSQNELSKKLNIPSGGGFKKYISNLVNAEIISEYISIDMAANTKYKKYKLTDEYLIFYFKYIEPNLAKIQSSTSSKLFEMLCEKEWKPWLGYAFERFCLKNAETIAKAMGFADEVLQVAPYYKNKDNNFQIDLVFLRDQKIYTICEIKYHEKKINTQIIPEMNRKIEALPLPKGYTLEKALISIHGME